MNAGLIPVLAAAAPKLMSLYSGMDAGSRQQLMGLLASFVPVLPLEGEEQEEVVKVLMADGDLPSKLMALTALPGVQALASKVVSGKSSSSAEEREIAVTCHQCHALRYITLP